MLALKITDVKDFMNKLLENFITISLILTQRLLLRRIPQNIPCGMM